MAVGVHWAVSGGGGREIQSLMESRLQRGWWSVHLPPLLSVRCPCPKHWPSPPEAGAGPCGVQMA